jgi:hypothetical protein
MITEDQMMSGTFFIIRPPTIHYSYHQNIVMDGIRIEEVEWDKSQGLDGSAIYIKRSSGDGESVYRAWCFTTEEEAKTKLREVIEYYEQRCKEAKEKYNLS